MRRSRSETTSWGTLAWRPHAGAAAGDVLLLLLVGVVVGVFGWVHARRVRERAFVTTMTVDLQRLALHQESSRRDLASFSADVAVVEARGFRRSEAVRIDIREATSRGWSAVASHRATAVHCYVFVGEAAPLGVALRAGEVRCV